jgi:transketolase
VPWDDNRITIDGRTDLSTRADQKVRFAAARWHMQTVDRHDREAVAAAIQAAWADDRRSMVACKTIIDFGAPNKQGGHDALARLRGRRHRRPQDAGLAVRPFYPPKRI